MKYIILFALLAAGCNPNYRHTEPTPKESTDANTTCAQMPSSALWSVPRSHVFQSQMLDGYEQRRELREMERRQEKEMQNLEWRMDDLENRQRTAERLNYHRSHPIEPWTPSWQRK